MATLGRRQSSRSQPLDRIEALEAKLLKVQQERNDLLNDVEALCMSGDPGSIFDRSNLLGERIRDAYREVAVAREQARVAAEQAADVAADLEAVRASKGVIAKEARAAREQAAALEKELAFYQTQSAAAMADRDSASWQAEEQRSRADSLQGRLQEALLSVQQANEAASDARSSLQQSTARIAALEQQVTGLEVIPTLERQLASARQSQSALRKQVDTLQADLEATKGSLDKSRDELRQLTSDHAKLTTQLTAAGEEASSHASEAAQLRRQLQDQQARGDAAQCQLDSCSAECAELRRQAGVQVTALNDARKALEEATQQKVAALMSLSSAQAAQRRGEDRNEGSRHRDVSSALQRRESGSVTSGESPETTTAAPSPAKSPWRGVGWLTKAASSTVGHLDTVDNGTTPADVHALRCQLSQAQDHVAAADALAERSSHLRTALAAITTAASSGSSEADLQTLVDELAERVKTVRVGAVLGLHSAAVDKDSADEGDFFSALSDKSSGKATARSPLSRELLDVFEVAVDALRALNQQHRVGADEEKAK